MKKFIFAFFLLVFAIIAKSQQLINKKDPFTGKEVKCAIIVFGKAIAPSGMSLTLGINNGQKYIAFSWVAKSGAFGAFNNMNPNDLSIMVKMDNDSVYKFKSDTSLSRIINFGESSNMIISSIITDSQLMALTYHLISIFRVGVRGDNGVDLDDNYLFTGKNKKQVQKGAAYMLDMQIFDNNKDN
jgi:hypothetical protein